MGYKDAYLYYIQHSQFQFLIFNINYLLKYKITSLIYQLLYTIKYIYSIGLASISTVIILVLPLVIFNPQLGHHITILSGYLVNRPQASIRYSLGTISPCSQSSRLAENSRDGSQGVTTSITLIRQASRLELVKINRQLLESSRSLLSLLVILIKSI